MVDLTDTPNWGPVKRIETTDLALGGDEANAPNLQNLQLTQRDRQLYEWIAAVMGLEGSATPTQILNAITAQFASAAGKGAQDSLVASLNQGRLSLASNTPVSGDVANATTVYFTPYTGNIISLYDGTRWKPYEFSEISLNIAGLAPGNYDVYLRDNSGTLVLETSPWDNAALGAANRTTTPVAFRNGAWVDSATPSRRLLGSFRVETTGQTEDSLVRRWLSNVDNQVQRALSYSSNAVHSYFGPMRAWNNDGSAYAPAIVSIQSFLNARLRCHLYYHSGMTIGENGINPISGSVAVGNGITAHDVFMSAAQPRSGGAYYWYPLETGIVAQSQFHYVEISIILDA